jgi:hypothetical protein
MIDGDKVLKGLELCSRTASGKEVECSKCPYNSGDFQCVRHLFVDALALLKAQQGKIELLQKNSRFSSIVVCRDCAYAYDTSMIGDQTLYRCTHDGLYRSWNGCCEGGMPSWLNEPNGWERLTGEGEKEQKPEHSDSPEEDDG